MSTSTVRAPLGAVKSVPFAALPHELRRDPRLNPRAVVLAATLLEYARQRATCWPSNARLASDMRCSARTVQVALAALRAAGWITIDAGPDITCGRVICLSWREGNCAPPVKEPAPGGVKETSPEWKKEGEEQRPGPGPGQEGPSPPAGSEEGGAPATAEEIAQFTAWADGPDPALAHFGRAALKLAGVDAEDAPPVPVPAAATARGRPAAPAGPIPPGSGPILPSSPGGHPPRGPRPPASVLPSGSPPELRRPVPASHPPSPGGATTGVRGTIGPAPILDGSWSHGRRIRGVRPATVIRGTGPP
jgi:hypothetical protein